MGPMGMMPRHLRLSLGKDADGQSCPSMHLAPFPTGDRRRKKIATFWNGFFFFILLSKSTHHQPFGYRGSRMLISFGPTLGTCRTVVSNSKHISSGERGSPLAAALKYDSAGRLTVKGEPESPYLLSMPSPCRVEGPYSSMESE